MVSYAPPLRAQPPVSVNEGNHECKLHNNILCSHTQCRSTDTSVPRKKWIVTFLARDAPAPRPKPAKGFLFGPPPPGLRERGRRDNSSMMKAVRQPRTAYCVYSTLNSQPQWVKFGSPSSGRLSLSDYPTRESRELGDFPNPMKKPTSVACSRHNWTNSRIKALQN